MTRLLLVFVTFISSLVLQAQENPKLQIISELVRRGVSCEDSSYVDALYWYEQAAESISVLDKSDDSNLSIEVEGGRFVSTSSFLDSVLPAARKRALAETDLFECGLLVAGSMAPDNHLGPSNLDCSSSGIAQPHFREMALKTCLKYDRLDLARRFDLRQLAFVDSAEYFEEFTRAACRRGELADARGLLDTLLAIIDGAGFGKSKRQSDNAIRFERVIKNFGTLLPTARQIELLDRFAAKVDMAAAEYPWEPSDFLADTYFRLSEFAKAETYAIFPSKSYPLGCFGTIRGLYDYYHSVGDSAGTQRILGRVYSMTGASNGAYDLSLGEFLIPELRNHGRVNEANILLSSIEHSVLRPADPEEGIWELTSLLTMYLLANKSDRAMQVLDSLRVAAESAGVTIERMEDVVDGFAEIKKYGDAEALIRKYFPSQIASECAYSVVIRFGFEANYEQAERFIQYISDVETRDCVRVDISRSLKGFSYINEQSLERTRLIVDDFDRLQALSNLADDMYGKPDFEPYLADAEVICERIGRSFASMSWYYSVYKAALGCRDLSAARRYLKKSVFASDDFAAHERANYGGIQSSYFFDIAKECADIGLGDDAERVLNEVLLPRVVTEEDRRYLAVGFLKIGRLDSALKIISEITNDCEKGLALIELAAFSENGIPKSDTECMRRMHQIVSDTQR